MVVRFGGEQMYLWRAVDHEGEVVLDMLVERQLMNSGSGETIGRRTRISRCDDEREDAALQVASIGPALPQHACRRPQYLQSSTPSRLAADAADLPSRG